MDVQKEEMVWYMPGFVKEHGGDAYYVQFWVLWVKIFKVYTATIVSLFDIYSSTSTLYENAII